MLKKSESCVYCHGYATESQIKNYEWRCAGTLWRQEIKLPVCKRCNREMLQSWADFPELLIGETVDAAALGVE